MPYYKARYKLDADKDGRLWPLGWHPNKEIALAHFNSGDANKADLGCFAFDDAGHSSTDYYLAEQGTLKDAERLFHLCMQR